MSCTRAETLLRLRQWGNPVTPGTLAEWMGKSRYTVRDNLQALYSRDLIDRKPHPDYAKRYLYYPKKVVA